MQSKRTIAVDVMGGDFGPHPFIEASVNFVSKRSDVQLLLVGDGSTIRQTLRSFPAFPSDRISVLHAPEVVAMEDRPSFALRHKRKSSMWLALEQVALGSADACVSAGNTGALMAMGRFLIKTLPGIDRPAICTQIPTAKRFSFMLDLGANASCTADQLYQFALMGSALVSSLTNVQRPGIGLLNIGAEEVKGNEQLRLAAQLIKANPALNYLGYIEGDALFTGEVPLIVCDGFSGNVALKASEGVARLIGHQMESAFRQSWWYALIGRLAAPVIRQLKRELNPANYNGASLLGLQGVVVKSHGNADAESFSEALLRAAQEVEKNIPERIYNELDGGLL